MHLIAHYCIHCQRHFIGKDSDEAAKRHMREAHDRQGTRRNIRVISIEVRQHNIFEDTVDLVDFEGTVEACYTPVDYVEGDDVEDANE